VRGVGAGRSAARAPGGAPISPARPARCIRALRARSLAGNAALPAPGLSFPGRACAAGGTPPASGALRALHITRALCARVRAVARTNSRARGLEAGADSEVRALERAAKIFRARLRRGLCRRVTPRASLRARHLRSSFVRCSIPRAARLAPRRGAGKSTGARCARAAEPRAGLFVPRALSRPGTSVPRAWVEDRSSAEDRRRTRASSARNDRPSGSSREARTAMPPAGLHSAPLCKRPSEARARRREGCPRPRTRGREKKRTGDDKRVYRPADSAGRVPGEGPGKRAPARALRRARHDHPSRRSRRGHQLSSCSSGLAAASVKPPAEPVAGAARARGCARRTLALARAVTSGPDERGVSPSGRASRVSCARSPSPS
jgi:hypothetical protein